MGEGNLQPQPGDEQKDLLESAKSPEVMRLERIVALLGSDSRRVLPRDSGGEIIIERTDDRLTVSADLPPTPRFDKYHIKWTLGLIPAVEDRVFIEGKEKTGGDFRGNNPLVDQNDIAGLEDVLDKAEESARAQSKVHKETNIPREDNPDA